ncbi:g10704 [Coccomyxa elongata]
MSTRAKGRYREDALLLYEGTEKPTSIQDMVTGRELTPQEAIAAHIFQQRWPRGFLATFCSRARRSDASKMKVLKESMLAPKGDDRYVFIKEKDLLWADLDGQPLSSRTGILPAKRACGLHAAITIQDAEWDGCLEKGELVVPEAAWSSPTLDNDLLQKYLCASIEHSFGLQDAHGSESDLHTPRDI